MMLDRCGICYTCPILMDNFDCEKICRTQHHQAVVENPSDIAVIVSDKRVVNR